MTTEYRTEPGAGVGTVVGHRRAALTITARELPGQAMALLERGFRIALVAGHHDTEPDGLRAVYLFTAPSRGGTQERRVELHVPLDRADPSVPSLATMSFPAGRFEREMRDLFGIVPTDHPLPRRLVRHFHWPAGWYPMLADAGAPPEFGSVDGPYPFRTVEGPGVYEIPVGPVHAGMIGPGHFRFSVVGETILNLKARLWFTHRGVEKLFTGRRPEQALELAERVSGDTAVGHALAYCQAVEDALRMAVSADAQRLRGVLLELERLYNHVTDLGALCNDVGHGILNTQAQRIREQLLRLNDHVTGHRLLRGAVHPGGARVSALPDPARLTAIGADIAEIVALALGNSVVVDRFTGTAVLTPAQAADLGTLGYVARASGLDTDARHDHPTLPDPFGRTRHTHTGGDVLSRFTVRAEEISASIELITALVGALDGRCGSGPRQPAESTTSASVGRRACERSGVGIAEGWRGSIVYRVELAGDGTLTRVKIVDPSFFNWPALPVALTDTIVPDFPLTNKSFNLSYPGNDL
jgi:Ni,Fe-hydrogenase III large subunit/Ni,Fe-hydrogenase III component G